MEEKRGGMPECGGAAGLPRRQAVSTGVSADALKLIAMVTMVIDHAGAILFDNNEIMRTIGRISFPIYMWLLVVGFIHTSSRKKYARNMALLAILSELPFDFGFWGRATLLHQNIFWTLLVSLGLLYCVEKALDGKRSHPALPVAFFSFLAMAIAWFGKFDYGYSGPVLALVFYLYVRFQRPSLAGGFLIFCACRFFIPFLSGQSPADALTWSRAANAVFSEACGILAIPLIARYNGVRRWKRGKYAFYLFYPAHLLILIVIKIAC